MSDKKEVYITQIENFLPNEPVDNDNIEEVLGKIGGRPSRAKKIVLKSNQIKTRYYAIDPKTKKMTHNNAELTKNAVEKAVANAEDFKMEDLQLLSCGTTSPDQLLPNHGLMVHGLLENSPNCEVMATSGICLSGITSLKYAYMSVLSGMSENGISTGSELSSAMLNSTNYEEESEFKVKNLENRLEIAFEKDFLRWMLSDGAGAMLLQSKPNKNKLSLKIEWIESLSYANEMEACMYAGCDKLEDGTVKGWKEYAQHEWLEQSIFSVKQDVKLLNENIILYTVEKPIKTVYEKHNLKPEDVDWFLPHYSSGFFRKKVYEGLERGGFAIPFEKWFTNLPEKGNTGSASIYIILEELFNSGKFKKGDRILCYIPESGRFSTAFMYLTAC